jgi:hypothetical protein
VHGNKETARSENTYLLLCIIAWRSRSAAVCGLSWPSDGVAAMPLLLLPGLPSQLREAGRCGFVGLSGATDGPSGRAVKVDRRGIADADLDER